MPDWLPGFVGSSGLSFLTYSATDLICQARPCFSWVVLPGAVLPNHQACTALRLGSGRKYERNVSFCAENWGFLCHRPFRRSLLEPPSADGLECSRGMLQSTRRRPQGLEKRYPVLRLQRTQRPAEPPAKAAGGDDFLEVEGLDDLEDWHAVGGLPPPTAKV